METKRVKENAKIVAKIKEENISRVYVHALFDQPRSLVDFVDLKFPVVSDKDMPYRLLNFIAEGSAGKVYRAKHIRTEKIYAIKVLWGVTTPPDPSGKKESKRERKEESGKEEHKEESKGGWKGGVAPLYAPQKEVRILNHLKSSMRIIRLYEVFYYDGKLHMVFEYMDTVFGGGSTGGAGGSSRWMRRLSPLNISTYMYQLLKALDYCHRRGIMHCDVKPGNIVLDHTHNILKLIDFGHAQFYWPDEYWKDDNHYELGTLNYKAPEMLFECNKIHYSVDLWAAGCIFLQMLFPDQAWLFFASSSKGKDGQIQKLNAKFGTKAIHSFCNKYGLNCFKLEHQGGKSWTSFLFPSGTYGISKSSLVSPDALDLLDKLLDLDPVSRITCGEALQHKYFS